jgi:alpha,alpha-trehalase
MAQILGRSPEAGDWRALAERRKQLINRYLWNATKGMFFDYDVDARKQSSYDYASTFYPLWVGAASPEESKAIIRNLGLFERPGGLAMSDQQTGVQWDLPFGWAPVTMIAVEGMRRAGFAADANRVSKEFLSTILENFRRDGTIREKYNVVTRSTEAAVTAGYEANIVGFGWTNAAFLTLLHALPAEDQKAVLNGNPSPMAKSPAGSSR